MNFRGDIFVLGLTPYIYIYIAKVGKHCNHFPLTPVRV